MTPVSYTHLRAHETRSNLVCRLLLEKKTREFHNESESISGESIGGAVPIRGWSLLTFLSHMRR